MKLSAEEVIYGYSIGIFPMAEADGTIYWYEPELRGIIPFDGFKVSKNLARTYRSGKFQCTINQAFEQVMRACATRNETWISEEIIEVYTELHHRGFAYSFETWYEGELVGGLYGVALGKAFFGESMFHQVTDASKVALVFLVEQLKRQEFTLLDTQYITDHLKQFGAIEIPKEVYKKKLASAIKTLLV
jgi:leucyl/phenylalanyl-tRNA--protein transferase